jgi:hypothetical protein
MIFFNPIKRSKYRKEKKKNVTMLLHLSKDIHLKHNSTLFGGLGFRVELGFILFGGLGFRVELGFILFGGLVFRVELGFILFGGLGFRVKQHIFFSTLMCIIL